MDLFNGENSNYLVSVLKINTLKGTDSRNSHLYMNCKHSIDLKARIIFKRFLILANPMVVNASMKN